MFENIIIAHFTCGGGHDRINVESTYKTKPTYCVNLNKDFHKKTDRVILLKWRLGGIVINNSSTT